MRDSDIVLGNRISVPRSVCLRDGGVSQGSFHAEELIDAVGDCLLKSRNVGYCLRRA